MNPNFISLPFCLLILTGCSGEGRAGHCFHIIFVIIPLGIILYLLNNKIDDLSDSLFKLEGKINTLSYKVDKDKNSNK